MNITYHAHIYFDPIALLTAAELISRFADNVTDWTHIKVGRVHETPIGPHPKGQVQIAFTQTDFGNMVSWLMLNRGTLDVLVHPETGDDLADHTAHSLWLGDKLPLDLSQL